MLVCFSYIILKFAFMVVPMLTWSDSTIQLLIAPVLNRSVVSSSVTAMPSLHSGIWLFPFKVIPFIGIAPVLNFLEGWRKFSYSIFFILDILERKGWSVLTALSVDFQ